MKWMEFVGPNFTLQVPTHWRIMASNRFQAMFLAPDKDSVRPNAIISIQRVQSDVTVDSVAEIAKNEQEGQYPEYEVLEEQTFADDVSAGVLRTYTWMSEAKGAKLLQRQLFYLVGQDLFTLTATRSNQADNMDELDSVFDEMIRSFAAREVSFDL